jgi:hypothetical protein
MAMRELENAETGAFLAGAAAMFMLIYILNFYCLGRHPTKRQGRWWRKGGGGGTLVFEIQQKL